MKVVRKILKTLLFSLIFLIVYSIFFSAYENIKINKMVNDFKARGIYQGERVSPYDNNHIIKYYEVPRETSHELNDNRSSYRGDLTDMRLGLSGDLFVTMQSPFPNVKIVHPLMSYFTGGHAAMLNFDEDGDERFIEAIGFPEGDETIFDYIFAKGNSDHGLDKHAMNSYFNSWQETSYDHHYYEMFYRTKYIGLRAVNHFVGTDKEDLYDDYINEAVNSGLDKVEKERIYNFLLLLDNRYKYYCTDLMSRSYEEAYERVYNGKSDYESKKYAKNMNDDGFGTTVQDLILSKDTFITFYVEIKEEVINNETFYIEYIYYLGNK